MKKLLFGFFISWILLACGGGGTKENKAPTTGDITQDPDYQKGLELVTKNNCFTCHQVEGQLTGPSYREVANKYGSMPDTIVPHLANKIIAGGTGIWGNLVMINHPGISQADAETMVRYILLLKK